MAPVPRVYSELKPYQSLAEGLQRNPTLQLKAIPWKSLYRTALLAQDKNPILELLSLQCTQIKVASFWAAWENSMAQIQHTEGSSCVWEIWKAFVVKPLAESRSKWSHAWIQFLNSAVANTTAHGDFDLRRLVHKLGEISDGTAAIFQSPHVYLKTLRITNP